MNTRLAQKLVEIGKMNEELTPREWYNKTIKFERTKKIVKNIFRKQMDKFQKLMIVIEWETTQITGICNLPIKNANIIDINIMKK